MSTASPTPAEPSLTAGAAELAQRILSGDVTAAEVVDASIERIEAVNPALNAVVIPLFDQARADAAAADEARRRGETVGPLHGVPVTVKEQFRVAGTQTTLGASARVGNVYDHEGPLVSALRSAGAIIVGKTNITQTLAGWESDNPVYGRTANPWDLERSSGGSSGGEAAIIAAGGSALGLAGDLGGSIRIPAHFCGVHGFKPTSRRLTNDDFAPGLLGTGQELYIPQPGPIARSVGDLRLAMKVFAPTSLGPTSDVVPPVPWLEPVQLRADGLRIGVYVDNGYFGVSPSLHRAVDDAAAALEDLGAVVEPIRSPDAHEGVRLFLRGAAAGGSADIVELLDGEKPIAPVAGLLRGVRMPAPLRPIVAKAMERKGQQQLARVIRHARPCSGRDYFELVEARNAYRAAFRALLDRHRLDAVICPPAALPAFTHGSSTHLLAAVAPSFVYNVLGWPAGVVSLSRVRPGEESDRAETDDLADITARQVERNSVGLPLGVQVAARHWDDQVVLNVMSLLEAAFRDRPDYPIPGQLVV